MMGSWKLTKVLLVIVKMKGDEDKIYTPEYSEIMANVPKKDWPDYEDGGCE